MIAAVLGSRLHVPRGKREEVEGHALRAVRVEYGDVQGCANAGLGVLVAGDVEYAEHDRQETTARYIVVLPTRHKLHRLVESRLISVFAQSQSQQNCHKE